MDAVDIIGQEGFEEALDLAYEYHDNEQYSEAIAYYRALIEYAGTMPYIADRETVTDIMEQLANCLRIVGDFPGAITVYDKLIEREGICAEYLLDKAELYTYLSQPENAAELRCTALEMIAAEHGCESLKYANALRCIAKSLSDAARYDEAEKAYSEALRIYRNKQASAFDTATLLQDIGHLYDYKRNYEKSLNYYEDALALLEKDYPEDSVDILSLKNDIAGALEKTGNTRAAQKVYEELLTDCYEKFGEDSYNTYVCEGNLAGLYRDTKDFEKAISLRKRALDGFLKLGGEKSRDYQRELVNYAVDLSEQRQYAQAIAALEEAYAIRRRFLGEHNISTVDTLRLIGVQYIKAGNVAKAAELFERSVSECVESEEDVTFECVSRISLAKCCILMLETEKAEQLIEVILALTEKADIESSYIPAYVSLLKAQIDSQRNAVVEAEENARLAVALAEQDLTCGEDDINAVRIEYAEILQECGQLEKAEKLFMRVMNAVQDDEYHSEKVLQILCRLAEIKAEQGDFEQAEFFAESAWEHLPSNHTAKAELALHYVSAFVAKFDGDLSRYETELGTAKSLLKSFPGNRRLAGKLAVL